MDSSFQDLLKRLDHLSDQFHDLREGVQKAVLVADLDPEMALTRARKVLELVVREVYERRCQEPPGTPTERPRWPMIVLRTPKGWTDPTEIDGHKLEGSWRSHQVPSPTPSPTPPTWPSSKPGSAATSPKSSSTSPEPSSPSCATSHPPAQAASAAIPTPTAEPSASPSTCPTSATTPSPSTTPARSKSLPPTVSPTSSATSCAAT